MELIEAIESRLSARAFLPTPVPRATVERILELARLAPSGSNMQPWQVDVVTGAVRERLIERALAWAREHPVGNNENPLRGDPGGFRQPYKQRRFDCGMSLYAALGIDRRDKVAREQQLLRNFYFFDAPVGLMFSIHRSLLPGQLGDLGIFMGHVMLAAREFGLHTCSQGFWQDVSPAVHEVLGIAPEYYVYNGMALGHIDADHPANRLEMPREPVAGFARFLGFEEPGFEEPGSEVAGSS
ncbi:MAG: nitroreductase family protein [Porticoccaceae bacterium]